ncbi:MAG TPA: CDGSH iron-sulfur domain-containing protein [Thermoanaerobaculia bacterium]|nr:CDGSH iron-sulfur domain-containing protein [Thermoanaerobaculia bacterium]
MTVTIKIRDNGPYLVEGDFELVDAQGNPVPIAKKALCRCGASTTKPFCDGTHSKIGFQAATAAVEKSDNPNPS